MLANETITVFGKHQNPETRDYSWTPAVIDGVSWYATTVETIDPKGGLMMAQKVVVRIPAGSLDNAPAPRTGDIIVKDAVQGADWTPQRLKDEYADDCITVLAISNDLRAPKEPQLKVVGS